MKQPTQKEYKQMVAIGKCADKMAKEFLSTLPAKEESWEVKFDENVNFDEAECGSNWDQEDIKSFIRSLLASQRRETIEEIVKEIKAISHRNTDEMNKTTDIKGWANDVADYIGVLKEKTL